ETRGSYCVLPLARLLPASNSGATSDSRPLAERVYRSSPWAKADHEISPQREAGFRNCSGPSRGRSQPASRKTLYRDGAKHAGLSPLLLQGRDSGGDVIGEGFDK